MDEPRFWAMIESAWAAAGGLARERAALLAGELDPDDDERLTAALDDAVVPALRQALEQLPADDLLAFDRILERTLHALDRADIHEHTDGSDDGFLYARGFIVAAGQAYCEAVLADPSRAVPDLEAEALCYLPWHLHRDQFGDIPPSGLSRETGSNRAGWPDAAAATELEDD